MILLCCVVESAHSLSVNLQGNEGFWLTEIGRIHACFVRCFWHLGTRLGQYLNCSGFLLALC